MAVDGELACEADNHGNQQGEKVRHHEADDHVDRLAWRRFNQIEFLDCANSCHDSSWWDSRSEICARTSQINRDFRVVRS